MKIVIEQNQFDFDIACRLLKMKYKECPFTELMDIWDSIQPMSFEEIIKTFTSIEHRRIAINCLGIERLVQQVNPELLNSQTIEKTTTWVREHGQLIVKSFTDTYELYQVSGETLGLTDTRRSWMNNNYFHYVKCKDTSTDREYLIWVDDESVYRTNNNPDWTSSSENYGRMINAIQAVAWTIQTNVPEGNIEKIVRQGDCILFKPKDNSLLTNERHLTEHEYLTLLVAES
jgi:hypothetical protein